MGRKANTVQRMLDHYVNVTDECWTWTGTVLRNGYGKVGVKHRTCLAHRVFYEHFKGPITPGSQIDHLCRNRLCVNPAHLEDVTPKENVRRSESIPAMNAKKTACHRGHELEGRNLYMTPDGRRQCRICQNARSSK